jgi:hypothetical protein
VNITTAMPVGLQHTVNLLEGLLHQPLVVPVGNLLALFFAPESGGVDHRLLLFGREHRLERFGIQIAHNAPQPHIEKVRKVGIRHIIRIRRVDDHRVEVLVRKGQRRSGAEMDRAYLHFHFACFF